VVGIFLFLGLSPVPFFFAFIFFAAMMNYKRTEKMSAKSFPLSGGKKRGGVWLGKKCVACEKNGKRDTGGKMVGKTGVGRGRLADGVTFFFWVPPLSCHKRNRNRNRRGNKHEYIREMGENIVELRNK